MITMKNNKACAILGQTAAAKREYTAAEAAPCSLEAMRNGGTCEACQ